VYIAEQGCKAVIVRAIGGLLGHKYMSTPRVIKRLSRVSRCNNKVIVQNQSCLKSGAESCWISSSVIGKDEVDHEKLRSARVVSYKAPGCGSSNMR
jgi:hypothetical protein